MASFSPFILSFGMTLVVVVSFLSCKEDGEDGSTFLGIIILRMSVAGKWDGNTTWLQLMSYTTDLVVAHAEFI